jgi:phosphatidylglycerophosphatase A
MDASAKLALTVATWFGCGRSPIAPGTVGSFGALPLHWLLRRASPLTHAAVTVAVTLLGVWAAGRAAEELGEEDPSAVVIDEVAGTLIALGLCGGPSKARSVAAFVLFRVLDIWKPSVIARAEKLRPAGLGIMADDVLAGAIAGLSLRFLLRR